jgi:hypothetical protein
MVKCGGILAEPPPGPQDAVGELIDCGMTRPARQRRASKGTPLKRAKRMF